MKYTAYLQTDYWKAVSDKVKLRAGYRCQLCNSQHDLCAHHRTYDHRGKELEHLGDLTCLCRRCHEIFHGKVKAEPPQEPKVKRQKKKKEPFVPKTEFDRSLYDVEAEMPPGESDIVLTQEFIDRLRKNNSFTNATLRAIGMNGKLIRGWTFRLRGKTVTRDQYREALQNRNWYNSGKL